jgi:hypothetical protein
MVNVVHRFITRLSIPARKRLFQHAGIPEVDYSCADARERDRRSFDALAQAEDRARGIVEAIAGSVIAVADKGELAERALRQVCSDNPALDTILEDEASLEERILKVWFEDPAFLDRTRNLTMSYHWRDGRFHCGYTIPEPQKLHGDISEAVDSIRRIVQNLQGGRRAYADQFSYTYEGEGASLIKHIAIYLETPASFLMEFPRGNDAPQPVLRREARELALSYDAASGRLDVAGKGLGGAKVFHDIAQAFCSYALDGADFQIITRNEWQLSQFIERDRPSLEPPEGFSRARITEIMTFNLNSPGSQFVARAGFDQDGYDRLRELGTDICYLLETVGGITITLEAPPAQGENRGRDVRAILKWPNKLSLDGATIEEKRVIERWLDKPPFRLDVRD